MAEAYIVDAVRTPVGKRNGSLAAVHAADLGAHVIKALVERNAIPAAVDDVIVGCVDTIGAAGRRHRAHLRGWRPASPRRCPASRSTASAVRSQQAVHFGAQAIMSGTADLIVAGGVQNMSQIPISSAMIVGEQFGFTSPVHRIEGLAAPLRRRRSLAVPRRRDDRREVGHLAARTWSGSRSTATSARCRAIDEGRFDARDRAVTATCTSDEGPRATPRWRRWPTLTTAARGRPASPPRCRARSPTARPRCCWPRSTRSKRTA